MKRLLVSLAVLLAAAAPVRAQDQAEPQVFNGFAVATAQGSIVRSGEKQLVLVGTLSGPFFVETDEGPVEAGSTSCAASLRLDLESKQQSGRGACTFTAADGATAWGEWECAGYALVGCRGKMTLNGGSGRFQGISGEGSLIWRPSSHALDKQPDAAAQITTSGLLLLREFKLVAAKK